MATETNTGLTYQEPGSLQTDVLQNAELNLFGPAIAGTVTRNFASDANITLVAAEYWTSVLVLTDTGVVLTTGRDVVFPVHFPQVAVVNSTLQKLTLKKSGQTGIVVGPGMTVVASSNATDVMRAAGGLSARVVADAGTSYSVISSDESTYRRFTSASAKTITVQDQADHALPDNFEMHFDNDGAGNMTFVEDTSVTVKPPTGGTLVVPEGGVVTLKRLASDVFRLIGITVPV